MNRWGQAPALPNDCHDKWWPYAPHREIVVYLIFGLILSYIRNVYSYSPGRCSCRDSNCFMVPRQSRHTFFCEIHSLFTKSSRFCEKWGRTLWYSSDRSEMIFPSHEHTDRNQYRGGVIPPPGPPLPQPGRADGRYGDNFTAAWGQFPSRPADHHHPPGAVDDTCSFKLPPLNSTAGRPAKTAGFPAYYAGCGRSCPHPILYSEFFMAAVRTPPVPRCFRDRRRWTPPPWAGR